MTTRIVPCPHESHHVIPDHNFSDALVTGWMIDHRNQAWFVEIEFRHHDISYRSDFTNIEYVLLDGVSGPTSMDHIAMIQERRISAVMSKDIPLHAANLAIRFEFQSGSSLLVACHAYAFAVCR